MEDAFLIGLEKTWIPGKTLLRATQIQHWLTLVGSDFPDLRDAIQSTFPFERPGTSLTL